MAGKGTPPQTGGAPEQGTWNRNFPNRVFAGSPPPSLCPAGRGPCPATVRGARLTRKAVRRGRREWWARAEERAHLERGALERVPGRRRPGRWLRRAPWGVNAQLQAGVRPRAQEASRTVFLENRLP